MRIAWALPAEDVADTWGRRYARALLLLLPLVTVAWPPGGTDRGRPPAPLRSAPVVAPAAAPVCAPADALGRRPPLAPQSGRPQSTQAAQ